MNFLEAFRGELAHEAATTRKLLERVPMEAGAWKPHAKSMTLVLLASHIAEILDWIPAAVQLPELTFNMKDYKPPFHATTAELLAAFDKGVQKGEEALKGAQEASLGEPWRLKVDGKVLLEMTRAQVLRSMVMNHLIHHRGQLTVYLRLKDVPLTSVYGPTADTPMGT